MSKLLITTLDIEKAESFEFDCFQTKQNIDDLFTMFEKYDEIKVINFYDVYAYLLNKVSSFTNEQFQTLSYYSKYFLYFVTKIDPKIKNSPEEIQDFCTSDKLGVFADKIKLLISETAFRNLTQKVFPALKRNTDDTDPNPYTYTRTYLMDRADTIFTGEDININNFKDIVGDSLDDFDIIKII